MRFHMGVSFNLRKLKRFFIPFLIGLMSYFGLAHFNLLKVNAVVQDTLFYNLQNQQFDLDQSLSNVYFGNIDGITFINSIQSLDSDNTNIALFIGFKPESYNNFTIYIYIADSTYPLNYDTYYYSTSSSSQFRTIISSFGSTSSSSLTPRIFQFTPFYDDSLDVRDSEFYKSLLNCISDHSSCITTKPTENIFSAYVNNFALSRSNSQYSSNLNQIIDYNSLESSDVINGFIYYYSNSPITLKLNNGSQSSIIVRNIMFNGEIIEDGDIIPTYLDQRPDDPVYDDIVELKGLSKYVFWFFNPESRNDLLTNLYTIMFLYVIGYFILKFITIIHNTKWRR